MRTWQTWVALATTCSVGLACSEPTARHTFGSYDGARRAALEHGCIEFSTDDADDTSFRCVREIGPRCECRVTLEIEGERGDETRQITFMTILSHDCPRSTAAAIAMDFLVPALQRSKPEAIADLLAGPPVWVAPQVSVAAFRKFPDVDVHVLWRPVRYDAKTTAIDPERADSMHVIVFPSGLGSQERPLELDFDEQPLSKLPPFCETREK